MVSLFSGLVARARSLARGIRRTSSVDVEMEEEFRHHIELRTRDLMHAGLAPADAARQARLEFGSTERYKEKGRQSRGLRRFDDLRASWLDFKLGFRMLVKYPGLTMVGGFAMAFAIAVGTATFEIVAEATGHTLPLPEGDRIVGIQNRDVAASRDERRTSHDFVFWREQLRSVRDLGAYRDVERNLILGTGPGEPVQVAEISAAAFRLTRVPPLLGRTLVDADEHAAASPVIVIGYDEWQRRFAGDSRIVGRAVRLGDERSTVVGVMPAGFAFPVSHEYWVPLRLNVLAYGRREGPSIRLFGRLAPDVSFREAQAELTVLGERTSAHYPDTHRYLRPQLKPFAKTITDPSGEETLALMALNLPVVMLVILVCANVALLMFARAATREAEIIVRTALGASRGRIIAQLFAEALVLGGMAAVVGLAAADFGLRRLLEIMDFGFYGGVPFWIDLRLSPTTVIYAIALTLLAAAVAGVMPALKVTRGMGTRLRQVGSGGGGLRFGGVWTAVIVCQVALTVAFPAIAFVTRQQAVEIRSGEDGFPANEYLSARLELDRELPNGTTGVEASTTAFDARFGETRQQIARRLAADPAVAGVTFASLLPRMDHGQKYVAVDDGGAAPLDPRWPFGYQVRPASVDPNFFDVFDAPILSGRGFRAADEQAGSHAVVVNQSFVKHVLGDRNPIGRRVRYVNVEDSRAGRATSEASSPWYEIVGVVGDLAMTIDRDRVPGIYHPMRADHAASAHVAVHVRGDPGSFAPRFRGIVAAVDPTLRLYDVMSLDRLADSELQTLGFVSRLLAVVSVIALTLSLAGIYAVMSFAVARRTREIGIRIALGANRRRVVAAVFRQPLTQLGIGIAVGAALLVGMSLVARGGMMPARSFVLVVAYAALMMAVSLLACVVPTRRALRVEPTEALRAEG